MPIYRQANQKFISQLSEEEYALYELKYIKKLSNQEIGEILGIKPNTAAVRCRRLIDKFKKDFLFVLSLLVFR